MTPRYRLLHDITIVIPAGTIVQPYGSWRGEEHATVFEYRESVVLPADAELLAKPVVETPVGPMTVDTYYTIVHKDRAGRRQTLRGWTPTGPTNYGAIHLRPQPTGTGRYGRGPTRYLNPDNLVSIEPFEAKP